MNSIPLALMASMIRRPCNTPVPAGRVASTCTCMRRAPRLDFRMRDQHRARVLNTTSTVSAASAGSKDLELDAAHQSEDHDDDQNRAEQAAGTISPPGAVTPGRQCANQQKYEHNDQNGRKHFRLLCACPAPVKRAGRRRRASSRNMLLVGRTGALLQNMPPAAISIAVVGKGSRGTAA